MKNSTNKNKVIVTTLSVLAILISAGSVYFIQNRDYLLADTSSTSATVSNALPVASSASIDSGNASVTLTENTTTNIVCTATVTDNNGCEDIENGTAVFYRTNATGGASCSDDDNDCYSSETCTEDGGSCTVGGSDLTSTYTCTIAVQYFADATDAGSANEATDWTCEITPIDGTGSGTADTDTIEMSTLTALDVTGTIAYGSLALGADTSTSNQTVTLTNTGNEDMDPQVSGTNMSCSLGSTEIDVAQQKFGLTDVTYGSLTWALSGTPTARDFTLPQRTSTAVTDDSYWGLAVPSTGVGGTCSGTNTFTAASGV